MTALIDILNKANTEKKIEHPVVQQILGLDNGEVSCLSGCINVVDSEISCFSLNCLRQNGKKLFERHKEHFINWRSGNRITINASGYIYQNYFIKVLTRKDRVLYTWWVDELSHLKNFYDYYFDDDRYSTAKLIASRQTAKVTILVFELLDGENLRDYFISHDSVTVSFCRTLLSSLSKAMIPLEQDGITQGDYALHNFIFLSDSSVAVIDFDVWENIYQIENPNKCFENEEALIYTSALCAVLRICYLFNEVGNENSFDALPNVFTKVEEYHESCRDVAEGIIEGRINTLGQVVDLIDSD